jgi:acyl-CoA carboxylase subunit beta
MARITLTELLGLVLDADTFVDWDAAGPAESVVVGAAAIGGRRVAVLAGDPSFLGGSIGVEAAERLTGGLERATREQLPVIAFPIGGGTRMQEGTVAFLQMAKITQAVMQHKDANLPYLVYLRDPTMGGVFASWGSLGHVQLAEPGALIGFLGPRVYEALYGQPFPDGVQTAENLHRAGIVDAVVAPELLAGVLTKILDVAMARRERGLTSADREAPPSAPQPPLADVPAWTSIQITRRTDRPGVRDLLQRTASHVTMLNGTGDGETHPGSVLALARFGGAPCVLLGQCRQGQTIERPLDPAALREARRGMRLSRELRLPLVTVIDTPGAALSRQAEERGMGGEIARTLADLITLPTPTISVLLGQGTGGIALALVPCDRVIASEHAWLAPLPPEGASAIVHRDTTHAAELAASQGVRAADLLANRIVDRVVTEPPDTAADVDAFCGGIGDALTAELVGLMLVPRRERLRRRAARLRSLGVAGLG